MTSTSTPSRAPSTATASRTTVLAGVGLAAAAAVCVVAADNALASFAMAAIGHPGRRSGILAALAALGLFVNPTGIPLVLAAASVACALKERDLHGSYDYPAELGLLLSALTTAVSVLLVAID